MGINIFFFTRFLVWGSCATALARMDQAVTIDLTGEGVVKQEEMDRDRAMQDLKFALEISRRDVRRLEEQYTRLTLQLCRQETYIAKLEREQEAHRTDSTACIHENARLQTQVLGLKEELNASKQLQQSMERLQRTAEILSSVLGHELQRASKRARL